MKFEIINFDDKFQDFISGWIKQNSNQYENIDDMENEVPELYEKWLETPAPWLGGCAPNRYFDHASGAQELIDLMFRYMSADVPVPDPLFNSIIDYEQQAADYLIGVIRGVEELPAGADREEAVMAAVNLINEIECEPPYGDYIGILSQDLLGEDLAELIIEMLMNAPKSIVDDLFKALGSICSEKVRKRFIHVLAAFDNDSRIYQMILDEFIKSSDDRALMASYLGRFGNQEAVEILKKAFD